MRTVERSLTADGSWEFPPASVSAVELEIADAARAASVVPPG
jgi:hypothetical protein